MVFKIILFTYMLVNSYQTNQIEGVWITQDDETGKKKSEVLLYKNEGKLYRPYNFNSKSYLNYNSDLGEVGDEGAIYHWFHSGQYEHRIYEPLDFDWISYIQYNVTIIIVYNYILNINNC